jgi:hypothetical protein
VQAIKQRVNIIRKINSKKVTKIQERKKEQILERIKRDVAAHGSKAALLIVPWVNWYRGPLGPAGCIVFASCKQRR